MSVYGLKFKEKHSYHDFNLIMKSVDRNLLPEIKRQEVDISSLDGSIDLQKEPIYSNKIITVSFVYHFSSPADMQVKKRELAAWLSGRANLIFDDEPDKYYNAKVFDSISINQSLKRMQVDIAFETLPFAFNHSEVFVDSFDDENEASILDIKGNVKTCGLITLQNMSNKTIRSFSIRRERDK